MGLHQMSKVDVTQRRRQGISLQNSISDQEMATSATPFHLNDVQFHSFDEHFQLFAYVNLSLLLQFDKLRVPHQRPFLALQSGIFTHDLFVEKFTIRPVFVSKAENMASSGHLFAYFFQYGGQLCMIHRAESVFDVNNGYIAFQMGIFSLHKFRQQFVKYHT